LCLVALVALSQAQFAANLQGYWSGSVNYTSFHSDLTCCPFTPFPFIDCDAPVTPCIPTVHGGVGLAVYENPNVNLKVTQNSMVFQSISSTGAINSNPACGVGINGTVAFNNVVPYGGANPQLFPGCFWGYISIFGFGTLDATFQNIPASFGFYANGAMGTASVSVNLISNYVYFVATGGHGGFTPCPGNDTNAPYIANTCFQKPNGVGGTIAFSQWIEGPFARLRGPDSSSSIRPYSSSAAPVSSSAAGGGQNEAVSVQSSFVVVAVLLVVGGLADRLAKLV